MNYLAAFVLRLVAEALRNTRVTPAMPFGVKTRTRFGLLDAADAYDSPGKDPSQ